MCGVTAASAATNPAVADLRAENERLVTQMDSMRMAVENQRLRAEVQRLEFEAEIRQLTAAVKELKTSLEVAETENQKLKEVNEEMETEQHHIKAQQKLLLRHFACISHEIRTPLNCIVGMSSLLVDTPLDGFQKESVSMITASSDLLATVIDDVLDFSKLESGDFALDIAEIDLQLAVGTVVTAIQMKADMLGRGIWIRTYFGVKVPRYIHCDSKRLQQIIYNLLGNAVKFSPSDAFIDLHLDLVESATSDGTASRLRLRVKDYGIGIKKENFCRIFEPFHQEYAQTATQYGGTGLGLSVTKRLTEKLGGQIFVDSEVGRWTTFSVDLPFPEEKADIEPYASSMVEKAVVLIVNSTPTDGCPFIRWLMDLGIPVFHHFACEGLEATAQRLEQEFSSKRLIFYTLILDVDFKNDVYSAYASGRRELLISFGGNNVIGPAVAYIANPCLIFPCMFLRIMEALGKQFETGKNAAVACGIDSSLVVFNENMLLKQDPEKPIPKQTDITYKEIGLRVMIAEDNKVNQKVLKRTLIRLGINDINVVDNGRQAVDAVAAEPGRYHIIFMDMEMPVLGGVEACREISAHRKGNTLPLVIFVTAHAMETFRIQTQEAGGGGFISKPFNVGIIDKLLRSFQWDKLIQKE